MVVLQRKLAGWKSGIDRSRYKGVEALIKAAESGTKKPGWHIRMDYGSFFSFLPLPLLNYKKKKGVRLFTQSGFSWKKDANSFEFMILGGRYINMRSFKKLLISYIKSNSENVFSP